MFRFSQDPKARQLADLDLFSHLRRRDLRRLAKVFDVADIDTGTHLTDQGHLGREYFVVLSGTADVVHDGEVLATVSRGELLGELAVMDNTPRTATVIARTPMRVLVAESRTLHALLADLPVVAGRVNAIHDAHRLGLAH